MALAATQAALGLAALAADSRRTLRLGGTLAGRRPGRSAVVALAVVGRWPGRRPGTACSRPAPATPDAEQAQLGPLPPGSPARALVLELRTSRPGEFRVDAVTISDRSGSRSDASPFASNARLTIDRGHYQAGR